MPKWCAILYKPSFKQCLKKERFCAGSRKARDYESPSSRPCGGIERHRPILPAAKRRMDRSGQHINGLVSLRLIQFAKHPPGYFPRFQRAASFAKHGKSITAPSAFGRPGRVFTERHFRQNGLEVVFWFEHFNYSINLPYLRFNPHNLKPPVGDLPHKPRTFFNQGGYDMGLRHRRIILGLGRRGL